MLNLIKIFFPFGEKEYVFFTEDVVKVDDLVVVENIDGSQAIAKVAKAKVNYVETPKNYICLARKAKAEDLVERDFFKFETYLGLFYSLNELEEAHRNYGRLHDVYGNHTIEVSNIYGEIFLHELKVVSRRDRLIEILLKTNFKKIEVKVVVVGEDFEESFSTLFAEEVLRLFKQFKNMAEDAVFEVYGDKKRLFSYTI